MSVQAISYVFDEVGPDELTPVQRLVLLSIANHADKRGRNAWPSLATIAEEAGVSRRETVKAAVRWLRDQGWIEVEVNAGGDHDTRSDRRPNRYHLSRMNGGTADSPPLVDGGAPTAPRGDAKRANGGAVGVPRTVLEPSRTRIGSQELRNPECPHCGGAGVTEQNIICRCFTAKSDRYATVRDRAKDPSS